MRIFISSVVIFLQLSPSLAFSSSSIQRGQSAVACKNERRPVAVGAGNDRLDINENNNERLLDDSHDLSTVDNTCVATRKGSIAAGVLGAATAQFCATKAFAVVGLAGAITAGSVDDMNTFQDSRHIRDETLSESSVVINKQFSTLKTSPSSISLALSSNILADTSIDDTSIVDKMLEKMATVNEKALAERIDEAGMKRKIQDVKEKALEDVKIITKQADKERSNTEAESITRVEDDDMLEKDLVKVEQREQLKAKRENPVEQSAQAEEGDRLKEQQEAERLALEQRDRNVADALLKEQQEAKRVAAEQNAQAEADARLKEQQEAERVAAEQSSKAEEDARLKEQQEAERVAAEQKAKAEAEAQLKEQQEAEPEAEARMKEQQEAERVAAEQKARDEEIAVLKAQLEAERQEAERVAAEQKAREEAMVMLKEQQEAERVAAEAARIAEQEKLQQEREVARIEAERVAEERLLAKLEKEEKTLIDSISKLEAQVQRQEQESAKIEVERRRQEDVLAKLEAEEKARTEQIERIDAQVLKLEKEADEAKSVLERLRKVEQAREDEASKAIEARKAIVAKIDSLKSLPSKTLSDFNSRTPQLQGSLELFKSKLPSIPEVPKSKVVASIPSPSSGQKILVESQASVKDMIKNVPEYAVTWGASAVLALGVITVGFALRREGDDDDQNEYNDDINVSTPYGLRGQGGLYSPTSSPFNGQSNPFSKSSSSGMPLQSGSFGNTRSSFSSTPSSQGYGMSGSGSGFTGSSPSTKVQPPLKGSTMSGNGPGLGGFTQTPKGGSFGSKTSFGGMPGGGGGLPTGIPLGKQFAKGTMKGSSSSFGSNQVVTSGSPTPTGFSFGQKGGLGGGGPGLSSTSMPFGQKGGGGLSSVSKASSGTTNSPQFPTGPMKGSTGFGGMQGGGLGGGPGFTPGMPIPKSSTFGGNPPPFGGANGTMKGASAFQSGTQKGGGDGGGSGFSSVSKTSSGNPPPFPTGPMKGSGSGFTGAPKSYGKSSFKKG
ncbi:hypothetical protein ACHAWU_003831 [Discostella pseudostelligera]|uniref:Uncharacterized protein n=1 Tax=Discostella pseudostelligera TaxID=259834 RepID=A0ABD3MER8_9STRA